MSISTVHRSLNKIKLTFDVQYKILILTLLTYLVSCLGLEDHWLWPWRSLALDLTLKMLASNPCHRATSTA